MTIPAFSESREASPQQGVGRAPFDHPSLHRPVRLLDVDVNPRMRIDPLHLGDGRLGDRSVRIKFSRKGVMSRHRRHGCNTPTPQPLVSCASNVILQSDSAC
jgi:hypothetical protein